MKPGDSAAKSPLRKYLSPRNLIYFALGLAVLYLLLDQIDFGSLMKQVLAVDPAYLLLGGLLYLLKGLLRALRLTRLNARNHPGYLRMLRLSLAASLASQLVPMKLGELVYVYLLKKENDSSVAQGLSSLMVLRLFDFLAISLLFLVITLALRLPPGLSVYFFSILALMGFLVALIMGLLLLAHNHRTLLNWVFGLRPVQRLAVLQKARTLLEGLLDDLRRYPRLDYPLWTVLAAAEWYANFWSFHMLLLGIGLQPTFYVTVVSVTFAALASVLPINSFGSFGTQEAGWATGMVLLSYSQDTAITSGFAAHILTMGYILLFGGAAWVTYLGKREQRTESREQLPLPKG